MMTMRRSWLGVLACALFAVPLLAGEPNTCVPAQKDPNRHTGFLADIKKMNGNIGLVFVGDSITDGWRGGGKTVWQKHFAAYKPLNLGIGGDRTEHVLWRLKNGELDGYRARLFVIMIGTNNGDPAPDVAAGITAIVKEIQAKQPQARILLLAIFPRSEKPDGGRLKNEEVNKLIAKLDDGGKLVKYMDIGDKFLNPDKSMSKDIMPDFLHPNLKGYGIWAEAIDATVKQMFGGG
jgi:lysophospholipase L1-like esterase